MCDFRKLIKLKMAKMKVKETNEPAASHFSLVSVRNNRLSGSGSPAVSGI